MSTPSSPNENSKSWGVTILGWSFDFLVLLSMLSIIFLILVYPIFSYREGDFVECKLNKYALAICEISEDKANTLKTLNKGALVSMGIVMSTIIIGLLKAGI